ncbi:MAG: FN3 domain-containing metallophosphoesterase family protein [Eubacteriales bacterium]
MKKTVKALSLFIALLLLFSAVSGASAHGAKTTIEEWTSQFEAIKTDTSIIALTPGSNEHEMNFAWLSPLTDLKHEFKLSENIDMSNSVSVSVKTLIGVTGNFTNKVTAADLKPNTVYYYSYTENGIWSKPEAFKTGGGSSFKAILVADTQIGRSGDETLDEVLLRDSFGWNSTLETAFAANPDINFVLSAGDQVNTASTNLQFNAFLAPKLLRNIPIATTMGNHDFYFPLYKNHFNNPNEFKNEIIESPGGSGYCFTYGQALFIVVNSNIPFPANQELLVKQAVAANPDAIWRVVLMHNSIYGAGGGEPNPVNLWRFYAPVFDKYKIDLVLSGHDHVHCRTYPINNGKIVDDGKGVVYLSENSSSGSKFSDAPATAPWYAANCSQLRVPTYSVLAFEEGSLTINTYRTDTLEKIDEVYVIRKQEPATPVTTQSFFKMLAGIISSIIMVMKASF